MNRYFFNMLTLLSAILTPSVSKAAKIIAHYNITATFKSTDPIPSALLDFFVTFDPSSNVAPTNTGLTINNSNLPNYLLSQYAYDSANDSLTIGTHVLNGKNFVADNPGYGEIIRNATSGIVDPSEFILVVNNLIYATSRVTITAEIVQSVNPPSAVPEPASWIMLMSGFGIVGSALRRKRAESFA